MNNDMKPQKPHPDDDLWYALDNNAPTFEPGDVVDIVAEVPGENDEYAWWWILRMKDGKFLLLSGSCDYTGWDCQSSIREYGRYATDMEAAVAAPHEDGGRRIRWSLIAQVAGTQPKFSYQDPPEAWK